MNVKFLCFIIFFLFKKKPDKSKIFWHFKKNKCDVIKMIKSNIKVSPPKYVCPHRIGQRWVTSKILNHPLKEFLLYNTFENILYKKTSSNNFINLFEFISP